MNLLRSYSLIPDSKEWFSNLVNFEAKQIS
jgi:hypothetical protein